MTITAKFAGTCRKCGGRIEVGDKIEWEKGKGAQHVRCKAKAAPALNSPPPTAMVPQDADPQKLAAKHGRQAVDGAGVSGFVVYGLAKGEGPKPDGSVRVVRGRRYVQVAHTARRYLSRDWLEDMDLFNAPSGGSYEWQGVEVLATEAETAAAEKAAAEKEARERPIKRRAEITALVRQSANYTYDASTDGLDRLWGNGRMAGSETMYGDATRLVYVTSSYDDGPHTWELADATVAAEAKAIAAKVTK